MHEDKLPVTATTTRRVISGGAWTMLGQLSLICVAFVTTPLVIRLAGAEGYGIVSMLVLIPQVLTFCELGMSTAAVRFCSVAYGSRDPDLEARYWRSAMALGLSASLITCVGIVALAPDIVPVLGVSEGLWESSVSAIRVTGVTLIFQLMAGAAGSPLAARLKIGTITIISTVSRTIGVIGVPIAFWFGLGVEGAAWALLISGALNFFGQLSTSAHFLPEILRWRTGFARIAELLRFGLPMALAFVGITGVSHAEKWAVAALLSPTDLAYYSIAFTLATVTLYLPAAIMQSLVPALSQLQGDYDKERLSGLYSRAVKLIFIWDFPVLVLIGLAAEPFLTVWAGADFGRQSTPPLQLMLIGLAFNLLAYIPASATIAAGKSGLLAKVYWAELLFYVPTVWLLVSTYGAKGAAAAWSARLTIDAGVQFYLARRYAGVRISGIRFGAALTAAAVAAMPLAIHLAAQTGPALNAVMFSAALLLYAIIVWKFILEPGEAARIRSLILPKARSPQFPTPLSKHSDRSPETPL